MRTQCVYCGRPLNSEAYGVYQRVRGWEQRRRQGGTNALRLPVREYEWACADCIDIRAKGLESQANLF